jgi:anti-sigma-K factor RskA
METHFAGWDERALELAVGLVSEGLAAEQERELRRRVTPRDLEDFEHAVASLHVAMLDTLEAPPADLVRRIEAAARLRLGLAGTAPLERTRARPSRSAAAWAGWLVAAGLLLWLAIQGGGERTPAARRDRLVASAPDLVRKDWTRTADPLAGTASGELVWSTARQEGYMLFRGLPANDPRQNQYQLWIFDTSRPDWEARPVDGGVFDVAAGTAVVVPVTAKLEVRAPALFAVTLEPPGGVVVSAREHLLLTAEP